MRSLPFDLRFGLRSLLRSPLFSLVAIFSLALGIGANAAIFSLTNQILLRPLPVSHPEQLVLADWKGAFQGSMRNDHAFSYPLYLALRDKGSSVFSGLIERFRSSVDVGVKGAAERVNAEIVSGNYFEVLGVKPFLGRAISPDDDRIPGAHPVIMLSYSYWQKRFGGRSSVLGQVIQLNGHPMVVIGVAPPQFLGVAFGEPSEVFVPTMMKAVATPTWDDLDRHNSLWLNIIGRLKPGVSRQQAEAVMTVLYRQQNAEDLKLLPNASARFRTRYVQNTFTLLDVSDGLSDLRRQTATPLRVLLAMVGTLLLVACVNLASLYIARGASRQKEVAIRLSLGATKGAIVRLVLVESLILSFSGALLGLLVSTWCSSLLLRLLPGQNMNLILSGSPDWTVLLFALGLAIVVALVFGLAPALQSVRPDVAPVLKAEANNLTANSAGVRFRKILISAQIALSLLLLIGAGLFARSLVRLLTTDTGFQAQNLIQFAVDPSLQGYSPERIRQFYLRAQQELAQIPGTTSISSSEDALISGDRSLSSIQVENYQAKETEDMNVDTDNVGPYFLSTMGIPLLSGREISSRDGFTAPKVALVSESFAKYFFHARSPLGHHFEFAADNKAPVEIVGVFKDVKTETLRQKPRRLILLPSQQNTNPAYSMFYLRTIRDPEAILPTIRSAMRQIDSSLPIFDVNTLTTQIDETHYVERAIAVLSSGFGLLATVLASIGLYGVMAYSVARRTRELGIRIALGAPQAKVLWTVMREVLLMAAIGVAAGLPAALALGRLIENQLFEMKSSDPLTLLAATFGILVVCALAGFFPAYRASRVDPMRALRYE